MAVTFRAKSRRRTIACAVIVAVGLAIATATNAAAWNQYKPDPYTGSCTGSGEYLCYHWKIVDSAPSTVVSIYLGDGLADEEVNLKPVVRDSIDEFNGVAALNPFLDEVTSDCCEDLKVAMYDFGEYNVFGDTHWTITSTGKITHSTIRFNKLIVWKTTTGGYCYSIPVPPNYACTQDARKVSNHEMGHAQGLAHEFDPTVAIMKQGFLSYYKLQTDDKKGLISIYGAYP